MKKILKYLSKRDYIFILISVALIVTQVWLELKMPDYMNDIVIVLQTSGEVKEILKSGGMMLLCALGGLALSVMVGFLIAQVAAGMGMKLRNALYSQVNSFSKQEIHKFSTASLITRCTNDTSQVQMLMAMGLQIMVKAPIMAAWAVIKILGKSWQWSVATAVAVVVLVLVVTTIILLCMPKFKKIQKQTDSLNRVTRENLTGMRIVHAFNAEEYQEKKFDEVNEDLTDTQMFTSKALSLFSPLMSLLTGTLSLSIYWIGASIINQAGIMDKIALFSDMMVFFTYAMQIISSFIMMIMIFMLLPRTIVSGKRIIEVLSTEPSIKDGKGAEPKEEGSIEFKDVNFKYIDGNENVLKDINLKINKGDTVAFIGATGCGKSTLIDLIPRFYDVTSGEVLVDGVNVKDYKLDQLHEKIGYVSQKAMLLSGTVYDNVTMGHNIEPKDVLNAIKQAQAEEFVENMDEKENSKIYQGGKNISGGQKQRLSIARAIAQKPEFIIFDDSFSALDYKTDRKLRKAIEKELKGVTCIIVAQRIGTIKGADKIVVLEDGKIVGMGVHEDLMKDCKVYQEIALSQLNKEEL